MKPPPDPKPADVVGSLSDQAARRKHRKDTSAFLWGTWLMLLLALFLGHDTLQAFRNGEWVDISADDSGLWVPWWLAAILVLGALALSLLCFWEYAKLKDTAPAYQPGDEKDSNE